MRLDLIDEFRLDLHPYVAGECTRLFDDVARSYRLDLVSSSEFRNGTVFAPLSRLIDPSYDRADAERSVRRAHADKFHKRATKRQWVNEIDVVVDVGSRPSLRSAA